jgi:hypothetical protein
MNRSPEAVRPRAPWRNPDHVDVHIGQDSIERRGELAGPVSDEEPELGGALAEIHHEVADLLGGPSAVGVGGRAQQVHGSVGHLQDEDTEILRRVTVGVGVEEVAGQHGRRRGVQELPPRRVGVADRSRRYPLGLQDAADGGRCDAVAKLEQLALDCLVSQLGFSLAMRLISSITAAETGGRPTRCG